MLLAFLILAAVFVLLLLGRLGGARREQLTDRWLALALAGAALFALARGSWTIGVGLAVAAGVAWELMPRLAAARARPATATANDPADVDAAATLGVRVDATPEEIRRAYRTRMAKSHPDRGGTHNEAARLTAARDRLLRKRS